MRFVVHQDRIELLAESVMESAQVRALVERIVRKASRNAARITNDHVVPGIIEAVERQDSRGTSWVIGFDNIGRLSRYLAQKEQREHGILEAALTEAMGEGVAG